MLNVKYIYSRRLKNDLIKCGFKPFKSVPNKDKPGFDVWLFEKTPELREAFDSIVRGYDNGK